MRHGHGRGFTLVEMLVVIGIIAVLAAILFPVFSRTRIKARETACLGKLHQIAVALRTYKEDYRAYPPPPIVEFSGTTPVRFYGGISALWPDYISSHDGLICPDDTRARQRTEEAKNLVYSSYNADIDLASTNPSNDWTDGQPWPDGLNPVPNQYYLRNRLYNYYGYDAQGFDPYYQWNYPNPSTTPLPPWLASQGLKWRHYPRLINRYAPDNTIITHCVLHRRHYSDKASQHDMLVRVGGEGKVVIVGQMEATDASGATGWEHQR